MGVFRRLLLPRARLMTMSLFRRSSRVQDADAHCALGASMLAAAGSCIHCVAPKTRVAPNTIKAFYQSFESDRITEIVSPAPSPPPSPQAPEPEDAALAWRQWRIDSLRKLQRRDLSVSGNNLRPRAVTVGTSREMPECQ